jgi:RNA polymerase sigma factor (sigma-70 family)
LREFSDIEIIDCLRKRQSYVVRYLSERYLPLIRMMVFQNGGSSEDAQDVFQDGLVIMLEKIDDPDFVLQCKFKTYLYCVCENLWKTVLDKRKAASNYRAKNNEPAVEKDISEAIDRKLYDDIFKEVYETLDEASRNILNLYWQDVSAQEIAERLGYTYGYVRKKKWEAQNDFARRVKEHPGYINIVKSEYVVKAVVK